MEQRNLFIAMALALAILLGWNTYIMPPKPPVEQPQASAANTATTPGSVSDVALPSAATGPVASIPNVGGAPAVGEGQGGLTRKAALNQSPRIHIESPRLAGSIALKGGRLDDLTLSTYKLTRAEDSPPITLLSPSGGPDAYFAEFGWIADKTGDAPGRNTVWQSSNGELGADGKVTMTWQSESGLVYERTIGLDDAYMFTIIDTVKNTSDAAVNLRSYALISRTGEPETSGLYVLHEGPLGFLNGALEEVDYDDLVDNETTGAEEYTTTGGWIGITDKYWLTALIPDQSSPLKARFLHHAQGGIDRFQTDFLSPDSVVVAPGASHTVTHRFFGGAKELSLLDRYEEEFSVPNFDKAIDFGWFYFLTKPFFYALEWFYGLLGNFGLAIMSLTVCVKLVFFPLANKSYKSMASMKALQPEIAKLRERLGDDRQKINQEMMALYKKKKVNPAAGCLPIVVQIPVFFSLYKVLIVAIEMRHAPFFGWIQDLSSPDPTNIFNAFGLIPFDPPSFLHLGIWPLLMGLTMFLQQRLNPQPTDPIQAKVFMLMPVMFTVLLSGFAAGLVIYWTWNNLLSITQQAFIMKRQGVAIGGGRKKKDKPAAGKA